MNRVYIYYLRLFIRQRTRSKSSQYTD